MRVMISRDHQQSRNGINRKQLIDVFILLALLLPIYGWIAVFGTVTTGFSDSTSYLMMADFYRSVFHPGFGTDLVEHYRTTRFPPLFPLLLGIFGAGMHQHEPAYFVSSATSIAAVIAFWWWVRKELSSRIEALLLSMIVAIHPAFFLWSLYPISEPLMMAMTAVSFGLLADKQLPQSRVLVVAALIGLVPLARMSAVSLVLAFALWLVLSHGPRRVRVWFAPAVTALLPALVWTIYRSSIPQGESYAESLTLVQISNSLGGWEAFYKQPLALFSAFVENWCSLDDAIAAPFSAILTLFAVVGWRERLARNRLDAWYLAAYLAMILVWPFPAEMGRFLIVVFPIWAFYLLLGLRALTAKLGQMWAGEFMAPRAYPYLALGLFVACCLLLSAPALIRFLHRAGIEVDQELAADKMSHPFFMLDSDEVAVRYLEVAARTRYAAEAVRDVVPPSECVYAIRPSVIRTMSDRQAVPYPFPLRTDIPVEEQLRECSYFFVTLGTTRQLRQPDLYPLDLISAWTEPMQASYIDLPGTHLLVTALLRRKPEENN